MVEIYSFHPLLITAKPKVGLAEDAGVRWEGGLKKEDGG